MSTSDNKLRSTTAHEPDVPTTTRAGLRLVAAMVRPHPVPFVVSLIGSLLFAFGTVVSAAVLGWVTDEVVIGVFENGVVEPVPTALGAAAVVIATAVLRGVGVIVRRYFAGMTAERVTRQLRSDLADRYLDAPMPWLRRFGTGRLIAHVDGDARVYIESLHPLPFAFGVLCLAVIGGGRLLMVDPWFALVALVVFPVMWIINAVNARLVSVPLARVQEQSATVASAAHESFEGAIVVKTLGRRQVEVDRFDAAAAELRDRRRKASFIKAGVDAALHLVPPLGIVTVVVLGAYRIESGQLSAGAVVEVAALFSALAIPMLVFGFLLESLVPTIVAWNRLRPVVEGEAVPVQSRATHGPWQTGPLSVELRDVTFAFDDAPNDHVLQSVNLSIAPGELVALVGATGSGKSTVLDVITGDVSAAGQVLLNGTDVADVDSAVRADAIVRVFQEAFLFAGSVRSNIDLRGELDDAAVHTAASAAAAHDFIEALPSGYATELGERGVTLSGGQRQRIALARALTRRPGLLLLDDATSALDPIVEREVLTRLRSSADSSSTTIVVAHRLATILMADRVAHLVDGRVAAVGRHEDLLNEDSYRQLVTAYAEMADG